MIDAMYHLLYIIEVLADVTFKVMLLILINKYIWRKYGRN